MRPNAARLALALPLLFVLLYAGCDALTTPQKGDLCPDTKTIFVTADGGPVPDGSVGPVGPVGPVDWTQALYMPGSGVEFRASIVKIDPSSGAADLLITGIAENVLPESRVIAAVPCFRWPGPTLLMRATKDQPEGPVWVYPTPNPKEARAWTFAGLLDDGQVRFVRWTPGVGVESETLPPIEEFPSAPFYLIDPTGSVTTEVAKVMMEHCVEPASP